MRLTLAVLTILLAPLPAFAVGSAAEARAMIEACLAAPGDGTACIGEAMAACEATGEGGHTCARREEIAWENIAKDANPLDCRDCLPFDPGLDQREMRADEACRTSMAAMGRCELEATARNVLAFLADPPRSRSIALGLAGMKACLEAPDGPACVDTLTAACIAEGEREEFCLLYETAVWHALLVEVWPFRCGTCQGYSLSISLRDVRAMDAARCEESRVALARCLRDETARQAISLAARHPYER